MPGTLLGGFRVPLMDRFDTADLTQQLALPVIMVVGLRMGCISQALLTAEAIAARGLLLAGWVANNMEPAMAHAEDNVAALAAHLAALTRTQQGILVPASTPIKHSHLR